MLPNYVAPIYTLTIPSTNKKIKYSPFTIKTEKALLLALQSKDVEVMINTLKDVIKVCIKDDVDVDSLAIFDLEYIFAQLRTNSIGNISELLLNCQNCSEELRINLDVSKIEVTKDKNHSNKIPLFGEVGVVMKYPNLDILKKMDEQNDIFEIVINCIDYIYDKDSVYLAKDESYENLSNFLESLSQEHFKKIEMFFETMPKFEKKLEFKCHKCDHTNNYQLEGLIDFF